MNKMNILPAAILAAFAAALPLGAMAARDL